MIKFIFSFSLCCLFVACQSQRNIIREGFNESPTVQRLKGEIDQKEYLARIEALNKEDQRQARLERNRDETLVYNLKTGEFNYLPEDYVDKRWNDAEQRWEYNPNPHIEE